MNFLQRLAEAIEKALGIGPYALLPPKPTIRQVATHDDLPVGIAEHEVPAEVVKVVPSPADTALESIIKAHRENFTNPLKGVEIVAPSDEEVTTIAALITSYAKANADPWQFFAAAMCQESLFAVNCRNGNYLGKNPKRTNEGTDWGVGQENGANLPALIPDCNGDWGCLVSTITSATFAVPLFCKQYGELLEWANGVVTRKDIQESPTAYVAAREAVYAGGSSVEPKWRNQYWLAALAYNRGRTGALQEVACGVVVPHPDHVSAYCNAFCDASGEARFMPDDKGLNTGV